MAKETMTGADEDDAPLDIVEVDELPAPGAVQAAADTDDEDDQSDSADTDEDDDEDDGQDARLAEADEETDKPGKNSKKNRNLRERRRKAKNQTLAELDSLRQLVVEQGAQIRQLSGAHQTASKSDVDRRIATVEADIRTAEQVFAEAIKAGNGDDAAAAQRIRDEARDSLVELRRAGQAFENDTSTSVEAVQDLVSRWKASNSWYGAPGNEAWTAIANTIDTQVSAAGFNKASPAYYKELSRRVQDHFDRTQEMVAQPRTNGGKPKKPTPLGGGGRETGANGGRQQVYVTPERKQAMIDAGIWDDPARRQKMLKTYADYDRDASAGR